VESAWLLISVDVTKHLLKLNQGCLQVNHPSLQLNSWH
jgi:hypothetical protein